MALDTTVQGSVNAVWCFNRNAVKVADWDDKDGGMVCMFDISASMANHEPLLKQAASMMAAIAGKPGQLSIPKPNYDTALLDSVTEVAKTMLPGQKLIIFTDGLDNHLTQQKRKLNTLVDHVDADGNDVMCANPRPAQAVSKSELMSAILRHIESKLKANIVLIGVGGAKDVAAVLGAVSKSSRRITPMAMPAQATTEQVMGLITVAARAPQRALSLAAQNNPAAEPTPMPIINLGSVEVSTAIKALKPEDIADVNKGAEVVQIGNALPAPPAPLALPPPPFTAEELKTMLIDAATPHKKDDISMPYAMGALLQFLWLLVSRQTPLAGALLGGSRGRLFKDPKDTNLYKFLNKTLSSLTNNNLLVRSDVKDSRCTITLNNETLYFLHGGAPHYQAVSRLTLPAIEELQGTEFALPTDQLLPGQGNTSAAAFAAADGAGGGRKKRKRMANDDDAEGDA